MTLSAMDVISWVKGSRATGLAYATPATFEATASGNAGGTTIVSTTLAAYTDSNDDLVGLWVRVLRAGAATGREDGSPVMRRIICLSEAQSTITLNDALGFQSADGDLFELLDPPTGYIGVQTAGETVSLVDATRDEANDWWVGSAEQGGPYVLAVNTKSIIAGSQARVGNSVSASGLISCASTLGASTAVGDFLEIWAYPEVVGGGDITAKRGRIERPAITGRVGTPHGISGLVEGGGSTTLLFRGPGASREGSAAECGIPLGSPLDESVQTSCVTTTGSATTNIVIATGTPVAGHLYMLESGDVVMCTAFAAPNMTVAVAPKTTPGTGATLYPMRRYVSPSDQELNYVVPIERWYGTRVWEQLFDCVPKISFDFERGAPTKINLEWLASQASGKQRTSSSRNWKPVRSTVTPKMLGFLRVVLGSTELEVRKATLDLGIEYAPQVNMSAPEMTDGFGYRKDRPSGTIEAWLDADGRAALLSQMGQEPLRLLIQAGNGHGDHGTLAFFAEEVEISDIPIGDDAGKRTVSIQWQEVEDTTQTTLPRWALGVV